MTDSIHRRKAEHITISLNEKVTGDSITTGMEKVAFLHNALPEIDFQDVNISTSFFQHHMKTPFIISSMTGGAAFAEVINRHLAIAAEERGWVLALGSMRALIESPSYRDSFQVRRYARTIPIIANLGAVQLNYGFTIDNCREIIDLTESTMLVLHLNSLQEVIQPNGDTNFKDLLIKIEQLCTQLDVPVGVKEVGWGIDGETAQQLANVGIAFIDVAGAGGTSWSQVEKYRATDPVKRAAAETFSDWGIPTATCIRSVRQSSVELPLIASGGMKNGLDAAKSIGLGADFVGFGRSILKEATKSVEEVLAIMETKELELKLAMFGIGAQTIEQLQYHHRIQYDE